MDPDELQLLTEQARDALRRGQDVRALAIADQVLAAAPEYAAGRAVRAEALLGSENSEEALDEARRAVALDELNEDVHRVLAMAAWQAKRNTLAQESFRRAIELATALQRLLGMGLQRLRQTKLPPIDGRAVVR